MRIVFMGSSDASVATLRALLRTPGVEMVGVVTQPDRPSGRHRRLTPCPCKAFADARGLPVISPEKVNAPDILDRIEAVRPDMIIVVAFGQFLGQRLLALPPLGCINGHFSLLPKHRGASPVQAAIAAGDDVTGTTIMRMAPGMDDGDMLLSQQEPICSDDTFPQLMQRLSLLGAYLMQKTLNLILAGTPPLPVPQNHAEATYASKIQKSDGLIDWRFPARLIERRVRAFTPWPSAFTFLPARLGGARVKIHKAYLLPENAGAAPPGTIHAPTPDGPVTGTGRGLICLTELQPDGGRPMAGKAFLNGHALAVGDKFAHEGPETK
jgi:methionyl-tRNA formyltransferase